MWTCRGRALPPGCALSPGRAQRYTSPNRPSSGTHSGTPWLPWVRTMSIATTSCVPPTTTPCSFFHPTPPRIPLPCNVPLLLGAAVPIVSSPATVFFPAGGHRLPERERDCVGRAEGAVHAWPRYPRGTQRVSGTRTAWRRERALRSRGKANAVFIVFLRCLSSPSSGLLRFKHFDACPGTCSFASQPQIPSHQIDVDSLPPLSFYVHKCCTFITWDRCVHVGYSRSFSHVI